MIKYVFLDLENTLYKVDQSAFNKGYYTNLVSTINKLGLDGKATADFIFTKGVDCMTNNNGQKTNADVFWELFEHTTKAKRAHVEPLLIDMYRTQMEVPLAAITAKPEMNQILKELKKKGYKLYLTTNPVIPNVFTERRLKKIGVSPNVFEYITHMENSSFAKPNLAYYNQVMDKFGLIPEDILLIGNDEKNDKVAETLGITCFLLTENNMSDLQKLVQDLPAIN